MSNVEPPAISRTVQYKKITKPLLERKRRARINRCLDELKELMVDALEAEGENISKLEKADILELTVRHLHRLHKPRDPMTDAQKFQAGFGRCAAEACQYLMSLPGVDTMLGHNLVKYLSSCANSSPLSIQVPNQNRLAYSPPVSPASIRSTPTSNHLASTPNLRDLSRPMTGLLMKAPAETSPQTTRGVLRNIILERRKMAAIRDQKNKEDSDVEIDIEKIDDKDDMWRPW